VKRVFIPTCGASDWRKFLADPDTQWVRKASAMELAVSWETAQKTDRGLPLEVLKALDQHPSMAGANLLVALPEHKVTLMGRGKPSQNDVWALLRVGSCYISMAVEGKAGEPFGPTLGEWREAASEGKKERLDHLCQVLQTATPPTPDLRYQLFHRTASAVLEARRFGAPIAVMIVQSFRDDPLSWSDYCKFSSFLGATAVRGGITEARRTGTEKLFLGWIDSTVASDSDIASVV
jgi:hypothetical protein